MPSRTCTVSPGKPMTRLMKSWPFTGWRKTTTSPRSGAPPKMRPEKGHIENGQECRE
jgi:hypothetical protein